MDKQEQGFRDVLEAEQQRSKIEVERVREDLLRLTFDSEVTFDLDSAAVKPGFAPSLDKIADVMGRYGSTAEVVGHTDSTGTESYNQTLSERRAIAVKSYVVPSQSSRILRAAAQLI